MCIVDALPVFGSVCFPFCMKDTSSLGTEKLVLQYDKVDLTLVTVEVVGEIRLFNEEEREDDVAEAAGNPDRDKEE